jgi:hypothetical protein
VDGVVELVLRVVVGVGVLWLLLSLYDLVESGLRIRVNDVWYTRCLVETDRSPNATEGLSVEGLYGQWLQDSVPSGRKPVEVNVSVDRVVRNRKVTKLCSDSRIDSGGIAEGRVHGGVMIILKAKGNAS